MYGGKDAADGCMNGNMYVACPRCMYEGKEVLYLLVVLLEICSWSMVCV